MKKLNIHHRLNRARRIAPLFIAIFALATASETARGETAAPAKTVPGGAVFVPGEILIQFKADPTDAQVADVFRQGGLTLKKHVQTPAMRDHGQPGLTHVTTALPVQAAIAVLSKHPAVKFAEPNWIVRTDSEANDPLYADGSLWGMDGDDLPSPVGPTGTTNTFGSQAEKAWAAGVTGSADVFIGIIDEGIQFDHADLAANIWTNPGEIPGNGLDDDGDGYVDDVHGWNAIADNGAIFDPGYDDHGTHVAGTIGAVGGNGIGVAGVNWKVSLISGKFIGQDGFGSILDAVKAMDYMVTLKTRKGLNIVALNNSWGGGAFSQAFLDSMTRAAQAGILFVVCAGNGSMDTDVTPQYPAGYDTTAGAGYDSVVSVAAITKTGARRVTSNWGRTTVDLGAPGEEVLSTIPANTYGYKSGTSMASPHVAGALALYASTHPGEGAAQAKLDLLTYGVVPTASLNGITVTGGRLDISGLLAAPAREVPLPVAPASVQAVVLAGGRVDLSWSDQSNNELGFAIERSTDNQTYVLADSVGANLVACSDRTVRPNTTYFYRVSAYNAAGVSAYASLASAVTTPPLSLPAAPANLAGTALPKGGVSLTWIDKANNEDGFQLERQVGTGSYQLLATLSANTLKYSDMSTVARTTYSYRIRAFNASGSSAYSNATSVRSK
jgi:subtilisin family serine protease